MDVIRRKKIKNMNKRLYYNSQYEEQNLRSKYQDLYHQICYNRPISSHRDIKEKIHQLYLNELYNTVDHKSNTIDHNSCLCKNESSDCDDNSSLHKLYLLSCNSDNLCSEAYKKSIDELNYDSDLLYNSDDEYNSDKAYKRSLNMTHDDKSDDKPKDNKPKDDNKLDDKPKDDNKSDDKPKDDKLKVSTKTERDKELSKIISDLSTKVTYDIPDTIDVPGGPSIS